MPKEANFKRPSKCAPSSPCSSSRSSPSSECLPTRTSAVRTRSTSDAVLLASARAATVRNGTNRASSRALTNASARRVSCATVTATVSVPGAATPTCNRPEQTRR
uniref:Uncharacterized protein n=1 Tax=Anopheles stephensi TaxID=30069 RepID=A0A182YPX0_ANOST